LSCGGGCSFPSPMPAGRWRNPPAQLQARPNQESESKPESDWARAPESESKGGSDLLWAREPEPESKGQGRVRFALGPRARVQGVRSGQTNPLWTKITPGIAGLAAGSHARRPALNEIREFRKAMPRPRRGSELVFGFRRPAGCEKQLQMPPHTPHPMRSACQSHVCMVFGVVTSPEASCGATWRSRHPSCTKRCVYAYPQLDIKGASICCTERGYISTVS
jgi:hypothetical protein